MKHDGQKGIRTEGFAVGYGRRVVVGEISLTVEPGKILTLIGPNGSGKSTILKSITRQLAPMGGVVYLDGAPMHTMKELEVARHLSMVMTERIRPEFMTCKDVVATGRYPYTGRLGILSREDWAAVEEAMGLVCAQEVADRDFLKVSDGQKQRVMLARAICQDAPVLVLDEPTSYLDMRFKLDILASIRRLVREKDLAVILSLHELDLAQKISDTVACVDGDRIGRTGTPEEVFRDGYIQDLYGVGRESFDARLGIMNLPGNKREPEVFVIGGGGAGIPVYYRLQRADIPFAAGILCENDMDYAIAAAIASKVVASRAFYPAGEEELAAAKAVLDGCGRCICTLERFGPQNQVNEALLKYAAESGKLVERAIGKIWNSEYA